MKRAKKGFTLIEVICVLTIIAIIAAIAVPNISGYIKKSKENNCRAVMKQVVSDLEYRVVSKRYYDLDELNSELLSEISKSADDFEKNENKTIRAGSENIVDSWVTELTGITGICPNGGSYAFKWIITPGEDSEDAYSANVEVGICECDCMRGEEHVKSSDSEHNLKAALVLSPEYADIPLTREEIFAREIEKAVEAIKNNSNYDNPSSVGSVIKDYNDNNPKYLIAGATLNSKNEVEWISMYYEKNFNMIDESQREYEFFTLSRGETVIKNLSGDDFNDYTKWPPAEGTEGSYAFKKGWNDHLQYPVAEQSGKTDSANNPVKWIQRDGKWYVQTNESVKGVNVKADELYSTKMLTGISVENSTAADADLKDLFTVKAYYDNNTSDSVSFDHILANTEGVSLFVKNGYIIAESEDVLKKDGNYIDWTGTFDYTVSDSAKVAAENAKNNYINLKNKEETLVESLRNGTYSKEQFVIAYQEYYKSFNEETQEYTCELKTFVKTVVRDTTRETEIDPQDSNISISPEGTVTIKAEIPLKSDNNNLVIPGTVEIPLLDGGSEEVYIKGKDGNKLSKEEINDLIITGTLNNTIVYKDALGTEKEIGTIRTESDYEVKLVQSEENKTNGVVSASDFQVFSKSKITITDTKGNSTSYSGTETEIPHINSNNPNSTGFFLSGFDHQYSENDEKDFIDKLNTGKTNGKIFYRQSNQQEPAFIAVLGTYNGTAEFSYERNEGDTEFDPDKINITQYYNLTIGTKPDQYDDVIRFRYSRKTDENEKGYYLTSGNITDEEQITDALNDNYFTADIYNFEMNDRGNYESRYKGKVTNSLDSISAEYTRPASGKFDPEDLSVNGKYTVHVKNANGNDISTIEHSVELNHDASENNVKRYYITTNEYYRWEGSYNTVIAEEEAQIAKINAGYEGLIYIVYKDVQGFAYTTVNVNTISDITISDFVYFPYQGDGSAVYMTGYIGSNQDLSIPETVSGIWSKTEPSRDVKYIAHTMPNGSVYYYIQDGNSYTITEVISEAIMEGPQKPYDNPKKFSIMFNDGYKMKSLDISSSHVQKISDCSFFGQTEITKINLGTNLNTIGDYAFAQCGNGDSLVNDFMIPSSVTTIGKKAFAGMKLSNSRLVLNGTSDNVKKSVESEIFDGAEFKAVQIGGNVKEIGNDAFKGIKIKQAANGNTLTLDNGVLTDIGNNAFEGVEFTGGLEIPDSVTTIGKNAFKGTGFDGALNLGRVNTIGDYAFKGCEKFTGGLEIPDSVKVIGVQAFDSYAADAAPDKLKISGGSSSDGHTLGSLIFTNAKFENVEIGGNVTKIDAYAFKNATYENKTPYNNIKGSLNIADTVTEIGKSAFQDCTGFTGELKLPSGLTKIEDATFMGCCNFSGKLTLPAEITEIGSRAFMECHRLSGRLALEDTAVEKIGMQAFRNCKNFSGGLVIPNTVTREIGYCAFENFAENTSDEGDKLTGSLEMYAGTYSNGTKIGAFVFPGAKFNNIIIGGIVTEVSANAFKNGDSTSLELSVDTNDHSSNDEHTVHAAEDDEYLTEVQLSAKTVQADYSGLKGNLIIENGVTVVDDFAFYNCTGLDGRLIFNVKTDSSGQIIKDDKGEPVTDASNGIAHIGEGAFRGCRGFKGNLTIPKTVTNIERCAFKMYGDEDETGSLTILGGSTGTELGKPLPKTELDKNGNPVEVDHPIFPDTHFNSVTIGGNVTAVSDGFMDASTYQFQLAAEEERHARKILEIDEADYSHQADEMSQKEGKTVTADEYRKLMLDQENTKYSNSLAFIRETYSYDGITGSLTIGDSVKTIGGWAFKATKFTGNLNLSSVTTVGEQAFDGCEGFDGNINITSVQTIGDNAFRNCTNLKGDNEFGDLTLSSVKTIGNGAFIGCKGFTGELRLGTVTSIGKQAFKDCTHFTDGLRIPQTVTDTIGEEAFDHFAAETARAGELVILSGSYNGGRKLGARIFEYSKFNDVTIGGNVEVVATKCMLNVVEGKNEIDGRYNDITGFIRFGKGVKEIESDAFVCCMFDENLTFNVSESEVPVSVLDNEPYRGGIEKIGSNAFNACVNLNGNLEIPESVHSIGDSAFKHFGQDKDSLKGSLTVLGYSKTGKSGISGDNKDYNVIGKGIFNHGHFYNVYIGGNVQVIEDNFMNNWTADPDKSTEEEKVTYYSNITGDLTIGSGVVAIGDYAFNSCKKIDGHLSFNAAEDEDNDENNDALPESEKTYSIKRIGKSTFDACMGFSDGLTIPHSVVSIGEDAFKYFGLNGTVGPLEVYGYSEGNGVLGSESGSYAIFNGAKFNNVTIGGNVTTIGQRFMKHQVDKTYNYDYSRITGSLTVKDNVAVIKDEAFSGTAFNDILELGNNVKTIGVSAFENAVSIRGGLKIPSSVQSIGMRAFKGFASKVQTPGTLEIYGYSKNDADHTLGYRLFSNAKFNNVIIGGNVHKIDNFAFYTSNFKAETVDSGNVDDNGNPIMVIPEEANQTQLETVKNSADEAYTDYKLNNNISNYSAFTGELIIEDTVTSIGDFAFANTPLTGSLNLNVRNDLKDSSGNHQKVTVKVTKSDGKEYTEERYQLNNSSGLTSIGESAFSKCSRLTGNLIIPDTVTVIKDNTFFDCNGFNGIISLGNRTTTIGDAAFIRCGHIKYGLEIPDTVTSIGRSAFKGFAGKISKADAGELKIRGGSNGTKIENTSQSGPIFSNSQFNGITIDGNVTEIGMDLFSNWVYCESIKSDGELRSSKDDDYREYDYRGLSGTLTIGDNVQKIGENAFLACAFNKITIGNNVRNIGKMAFMYTGDGTGSLTINGGSNGTELGTPINGNEPTDIFLGASFKDITIGGSVTKIRENFMHHDLNYANETNENKANFLQTNVYYKQGRDYSGIKGTLTIGEGVTEVCENAFFDCRNLSGSLELPASLETIGKEAFHACGFDGTLNLNNVKYISDAAFSGCAGFYTDVSGEKQLVIPSSVEKLGNQAFYKFAFDNTSAPSLKILGGKKGTDSKVTLPEKVFQYARFNDVYIGGKIEKLDSDCMNNNESDNNKFYNDDGSVDTSKKRLYEFITGSLYIGRSVTDIGSNAFSECESFTGTLNLNAAEDTVTNLTNNTGVVNIGENAFIRCKKFTGGLTIPNTVSSISKCAFKQFASGINQSEAGALEIYGGSNGTVLENTSTSGPIFTGGKYNDVIIGGKVTKIGSGLFNNWKHINDENDDSKKFPYTGASDEKDPSSNYHYINFKGTLTIKDNVTDIEMLAFAGNKFDNVVIGNKVKAIGKLAFMYSGTGKGKLTINGGSLDKIIGLAPNDSNQYTEPIFMCSRYNSVEIGTTSNSTTTVGADFMKHDMNTNSEFHYEKLHYQIPWDYSGIKGSLKFGDSVEKIDERAFSDCSGLDGSLTFGSRVKTIENNAFFNCKNLTGSLIFPDAIESIGVEAFHACGFNGILDLKNVKKINNAAFSGCSNFYTNASGSNNKITITDNVILLGENAFYKFGYNNNNPASYPAIDILGGTLRTSDNKIVLNAKIMPFAKFNGVKIAGKVYEISKDFMNNTLDGDFYDDSGNKSLAKMYSNIKGYLNIDVEKIGEKAFNSVLIDSLYIGTKVNQIDTFAFERTGTGNGSITLYGGNSSNQTPNGQEFSYSSYKNMTIGGSITTIKEKFMQSDENIYDNFKGTLTIEDTVTTIESLAFSKAVGFDNLYVGKNVTSMGASAFESFGSGNGSLTLRGTSGTSYAKPWWDLFSVQRTPYKSINSGVFTNSAFTDVTIDIADGLIGAAAFQNCSNFKGTLTITANVKSVLENSFKGTSFTSVNKVKSVRYGTDLAEWTSNKSTYQTGLFSSSTCYDKVFDSSMAQKINYN